MEVYQNRLEVMKMAGFDMATSELRDIYVDELRTFFAGRLVENVRGNTTAIGNRNNKVTTVKALEISNTHSY